MISYYKIDNGYIAVNWSMRDPTRMFVFGKGPTISGDMGSITDQGYRIADLPPSVAAVDVPVAWQQALGLADVVLPPAPVQPLPSALSPEAEEYHELISQGFPQETQPSWAPVLIYSVYAILLYLVFFI